jgi:hypothetical protein
MKRGQEPDSTAVQLARAALVAIKGSTQETYNLSGPPEVFWIPQAKWMGFDEVVETLATMTKPVTCRASVRTGRLAIACEPLLGAEGKLARQGGAFLWDEFGSSLRQRFGGNLDEKQALVYLDEGSAVRIPVKLLAQLLMDYDGDWALALDFEHSAVRAGEADVVLSVGYGTMEIDWQVKRR